MPRLSGTELPIGAPQGPLLLNGTAPGGQHVRLPTCHRFASVSTNVAATRLVARSVTVIPTSRTTTSAAASWGTPTRQHLSLHRPQSPSIRDSEFETVGVSDGYGYDGAARQKSA